MPDGRDWVSWAVRLLTLPLVGRVARRSEAQAGGVGVVVQAAKSQNSTDP
jgi:hypothetical protein